VAGRFRTKITKLQQSMSLTGAIVALAVGVIFPILLSTSIGIILLVIGESSKETVFGVLVLSFAAAAFGSAIVVTVLLGRRARLARLQADFTANITHELRTPLAAIRMYAQTLSLGRLEGDPQKTAESLETILRETEWLGTMIDRVLAWRKASQDRDVLEMTRAPLAEAVRGAVARFERMVAPGEVALEVALSGTTPVDHDENGIVSVTLNLLINAYKYTGAHKEIRVALDDVEGGVELSVSDNGIGIPKREVVRIFEPFYRVDSRLRGKSAGAGLGLAIVRHQARAHRGEVFVESEEGAGTKFTVRLPAADPEEAVAR
jgi:two-component system, OmpR family, phosphate regulon sensor histidine kinase PhoR